MSKSMMWVVNGKSQSDLLEEIDQLEYKAVLIL